MIKRFRIIGCLPGRAALVMTAVLFSMVVCGTKAEIVTRSTGVLYLKLDEYVRLILERNETLQIRLLEMEISRRRFNGEKGIFEPELVASYDHVNTSRENTAEQARNLRVDTFEERNNIYNGGLESLIPTGARVRLGYTVRDLNNNLFDPLGIGIGSGGFTNQFSSFVGVNVTQPLLKNAWRPASMANIRLAALASDIAFQEYRRQLMLLISAGEAAYWNLYMAQEQLLFFRESVGLAQTILKDNRERFQAGRGAELEVFEAESALALRKSRQSEALQKYYEAANRLAMLYSESILDTNQMIVAVEEPKESNPQLDYFQGWQNAFELNPDYQAQQKKLLQEKIRIAYARNQRWPQLDMKASYGLNGLGDTPNEAWEDITAHDFPSWSIGLELRLPITGGIKPRNEFASAKLRQQQALLTMKELETQISNGLDTALRKVNSSLDSVASYQSAVAFTRNLLDSQLARLEVGRVESRKVLEVEEDLFEAKNSLVESLVNFKRALLEWELIQGSVLKARQLDLSKRELESRTSKIVRFGELTEKQYQTFVEYLKWEYNKNAQFKEPPRQAWNYSTPIPTMDHSATPEPMSGEDYNKAVDLLHSTQSPISSQP